jgi:hypothetical protein
MTMRDSDSSEEQATIALCGALLQIAKTGITGKAGANKGKMTVSQPGRMVDGLTLSEIIWGGRNQSMHHESAPSHPITKKVFNTLSAVHGSRFDATIGYDLAREVVTLLGWTDVTKYEADMETILV